MVSTASSAFSPAGSLWNTVKPLSVSSSCTASCSTPEESLAAWKKKKQIVYDLYPGTKKKTVTQRKRKPATPTKVGAATIWADHGYTPTPTPTPPCKRPKIEPCEPVAAKATQPTRYHQPTQRPRLAVPTTPSYPSPSGANQTRPKLSARQQLVKKIWG
eukprot:TRINITY_DN3584_c0_g1_i2.p1 TRINITY_DN3584_c0_g1~~TRINITY_DN3584_c0_g1_i2.p1  ORF type:complete len:159 (+),score=14.32 TRINITY_DN3584_c0_g1_i2:70-546(+)